MEEDINIIKLIMNETYSNMVNIDGKRIYKLSDRKRQAIENLIKGYKELEEELEWRIEQKVLDYRYVDKNMLRKDIIQRDYIPKSKVREKIKKYNDKMAEQLYIIKEFGEHKGNREKLTMYKDYRDAYGELLQKGDDK